jgi:hypothetical protein
MGVSHLFASQQPTINPTRITVTTATEMMMMTVLPSTSSSAAKVKLKKRIESSNF